MRQHCMLRAEGALGREFNFLHLSSFWRTRLTARCLGLAMGKSVNAEEVLNGDA